MSECPPCRRFHEALQWGVAELRKQPRVLPSDDFQQKLERRIRAEASGFAPLARSWPGAAAMLMSLTVVAAGTFGWELARGGPAHHDMMVESVPPIVSGIYAPKAIHPAHHAAARPAPPRSASISFDSADLDAHPRSGELAAIWAPQ